MMMPPGFVGRGRSNGRSHVMANGAPLGFPYPEVSRMEAGSGAHAHPSRHALPNVENFDGQPRISIPATMAMASAVGPGPSEVWDPQAMAAHRHRTIIAERYAARRQQVEWEAHNARPLQACPPGFRYPVEAAVIQRPNPVASYSNAEPIVCRPQYNRNERVDDSVGKLDIVRGHSQHGPVTMGPPERRGWLASEGFSTGGGMHDSNRIVHTHKLSVLQSQPQPPIEQPRNQLRGPDLKWEGSWREPLSQYGGGCVQPSKKSGLPMASYQEKIATKIEQEENAASNREPTIRRRFDNSDGSLHSRPPKRARTGQGAGPLYGSSRWDLQMEGGWSDGSRRVGEGFPEGNSAHSSSSQVKKHPAFGRLPVSEEGRVECPPPPPARQQSRTRSFPPPGFPERGRTPPPVKERSGLPSEPTQDSNLHSRSSWSRPPRRESSYHNDQVPLWHPPKPGCFKSKEKHPSHNSSAVTHNSCIVGDVRSSFQGRGSKSPDGHRQQVSTRRPTREVDNSLRKDRRSVRLLSREGTDERGLARRPARTLEGRVESDGQSSKIPTIILHSSSGVAGVMKEGRAGSNSQSPLIGRGNPKGQNLYVKVPKKTTNASKPIPPASTNKVKAKAILDSSLRTGSSQVRSEVVLETEQSGDGEKKMLSHKNPLQRPIEAASLSCVEQKHKVEENQAVSVMKPVSSEAPTIMGSLRHSKSTSMLEKSILQAIEAETQCTPDKVTPRRRGSSASHPDKVVAKPSGALVGKEPLAPGEQGLIILRTPSIKLDPIDAGVSKQLKHMGSGSEVLLGSKTVSEKSSQGAMKRKRHTSEETVNIESGLLKPVVKEAILSTEAKSHQPCVERGPSHGPDIEHAATGEAGNGLDGNGKKVIFTGHKSDQCPKDVMQRRTGTGSHSPHSLGKPLTPRTSLSREQALENCSSRQANASLASAVVKKDKGSSQVSPPIRNKRACDISPVLRSSVPSPELPLPDKDQENITQGKSEKSEVITSTRTIREDEDMRLSGKAPAIADGSEQRSSSSMDPSSEGALTPAKRLSSNSVMFSNSLKVGPQMPHANSVKPPCNDHKVEVRAIVPAGKPALSPDNPATREVRLFGTNLNASKSVIAEGDKEFQANHSTNEGCQSTAQTDLQMLPALGGSKQADAPCQVISTGADSATAGVSGKVLENGGEAIVIQEKESVQTAPQHSEKALVHVDLQSGKRQKIRHLEREGANPEQTSKSEDPVCESNKTGDSELQYAMEGNNQESPLVEHLTTETVAMEGKKQESPLVEQLTTNLDGSIRHLPVFQTVDTTPTAIYPSLKLKSSSQMQDPRSGIVGRPYGGNKTWRRDSITGSTQNHTNQLGHISALGSAVVPQPAAYVRKRNSIIRSPAPQTVNSLSAGVQPTALSGPPQDPATESASKDPPSRVPILSRKSRCVSVSQSATAGIASASVRPAATIHHTPAKTVELGVVASGQPGPSLLLKPSPPPGDQASENQSGQIEPHTATLSGSKVSAGRSSHIEPSSGVATSACIPAHISPGQAAGAVVGYVVSGTRLYMQRKANQLIVAPSPESSAELKPVKEKSDVPLGCAPVDFYVKRKTNQLVRYSVHKETGDRGALQDDVEAASQRLKAGNRQRRGPSQLKTKLGRVLGQKTGLTLGSARVWTLTKEARYITTGRAISRGRRYPPSLFPWKRVSTVARRRRTLPEGKKGALFLHISNKLQRFRSGHPVYTRSADGFSLHRSGVVSQCGANLKWTKSLEKQSILASEAATKVVAEAEKKKRDRKEAVGLAVAKARAERSALQSAAMAAILLPGSAGVPAAGSVDSSSASMSELSQIGGAIYVRKGFGNQLVRDLKTATRAFASEKVRWSLHNARFRRAKKQAFCVYYTRFGECKRGDGKCLYIHDADKVAVCTKFLKGSCSNPDCRLTHKVIPERMSDCSYFLEGLCTNESCPYRHVNVNPRAPICEGFLRGYCADGDRCNKKHTYVCPEYTQTGKCSHSGTCKLHHPKKTKQQLLPPPKEPVSVKRDRRYFTPTAAPATDEQRYGEPANPVSGDATEPGDERADFISIEEVRTEPSRDHPEPDRFLDPRKRVHLGRLPKDNGANAGLENLLKPRLLLERFVMST